MRARQRRAVGKQGFEITRMGVGGTGFGNIYAPVEDQTASDIIECAFVNGVRYFDTAPLYGYGLSEKRLGAALQRFRRNDITISTKVGYSLVPLRPGEQHESLFAEPPPYKAVFDYSRDAVLRSIDSSLERLRTNNIDILFIHDPDESISIQPGFKDPYAISHFVEVMEQTYPVLDDLRSQEIVQAIGLGMNQWQMLCDFARAGDFDCFLLAGRYTLLEQESLAELLPLCQDKKIDIIVGGPYNSGILATGAVRGARYNYTTAAPDLISRVKRIESICVRHEVPLQAAALQFPFGHPTIASIIPGASSVDEFKANLAFLELPIPIAFWEELQGEELIDPAAPVPPGS